MTTTQTAPALHHAWRDGAASRLAVGADLDSKLDNLKACVRWLTAQGISVISADLRRHNPKPRITVVASPLLHILLKDDCASAGQHWDILRGQTMHDWVAVRYECEIRWEEAQ
jgi:hypothetical protein